MAGDQELVTLLKAGDADALEQLIARWRPGAEAYACSLLHDSQAAEDAVQEAFARLYAVRTDIDERRSFSAYLYTIVKRICLDELRKRKRFPELPGELPDPPVPSAEAEYAGLDETDRQLLLAFSLEGKPTKQIAGEMNLTDGQVRVRLHRIRRKMRKGMKEDA